MTSDRELVWRWLRGWAQIHDHPVTELDGGWHVRIDRPSRDTEIITVEPTPGQLDAHLARIAGDARAMLTVIGHDLTGARATALPPGVKIERDDETFMTTTLGSEAAPLSDGYHGRWTITPAKATYVVEQGATTAAEGTVGLVGTDAVFDAVETYPAHRRRGLARHVMTTLSRWATSEGATTGLLAASTEGRLLYETLGWEATLPMLSFMGDASHPPS